MERDEIIKELKRALERRQEIIFAYLYGSFAEGLPHRDIDIAVYIDERIAPTNYAIEYGLRLSAMIEIETRISPLDIKVINLAPVGLRYFATKGMLLFSRDDEIRFDFLEETWKRYFDLLPKRRDLLIDIVSS